MRWKRVFWIDGNARRANPQGLWRFAHGGCGGTLIMAHLATLGFACSPFASLFCEANKTARMQKRAASERA